MDIAGLRICGPVAEAWIAHRYRIARGMMIEWLLLWLCYGRELKLNPGNETDGPDGAGRDNTGWRLAHSRDREILQILFPEATAAEDIPSELFAISLATTFSDTASMGTSRSLSRRTTADRRWRRARSLPSRPLARLGKAIFVTM